MNDLIIQKLHKFPHDVDIVVGIPRSGMLPANLIALYLNKPFTDIDSFIEGRLYSVGDRGHYMSTSNTGKVLIVDDSIMAGYALNKAKLKLEKLTKKYDLIFVSIFASSEGAKKVDIFLEIINGPRIFQWNFFHHKTYIPKACVDIDGVLCQNPPIDDDGPQYINYISNAKPYFLPSVEIDTLVSCRLEKYRAQTEKWLSDNGIKYKKLILLDFTSKEERIRWGKHGEYKGQVYKDSPNVLFIESSLSEARDICRVSGKQVFCVENFEMLYSKKQVYKKKIVGVLRDIKNRFNRYVPIFQV